MAMADDIEYYVGNEERVCPDSPKEDGKHSDEYYEWDIEEAECYFCGAKPEKKEKK